MSLVCYSCHLTLMSIRLAWLCGIYILLILHVFETYRILRLIDELWIDSYLVAVVRLYSLCLIHIHTWFRRLLRGFSWTCCWILSTGFDTKPVLRNILHYSWMHALFLHLQLLKLELLLELHCLLLLGTKVMSAVQHLLRIIIKMHVWVWLADVLIHHHWTWYSSSIQNIRIRIRVLPREEPSLCMSFPIINHSLIGTWALTLCKVDIVSKPIALSSLAIDLLLTS